MNNISIDNKINHLNNVRGIINEDTFKYVAAEIYTQHYIEQSRIKNKRVGRQTIMDRVNLMLRKESLSEVSYTFFRKYKMI